MTETWLGTLPFAIKGNVFLLCEAHHDLISEAHPTGCKHRWPTAIVRMKIKVVEVLRDVFPCLFMRIYDHIPLISANGNCMHFCIHDGMLLKKIFFSTFRLHKLKIKVAKMFYFGVKLLLS